MITNVPMDITIVSLDPFWKIVKQKFVPTATLR